MTDETTGLTQYPPHPALVTTTLDKDLKAALARFATGKTMPDYLRKAYLAWSKQ